MTHLAKTYADKVKWHDIDRVVENLFVHWRDNRVNGEAFGDFCTRVGLSTLPQAHPPKVAA